jgi:hypothetical protein
MLWQGAKWRILKNFNVQNEECHNYDENTWTSQSTPHNHLIITENQKFDLYGLPKLYKSETL